MIPSVRHPLHKVPLTFSHSFNTTLLHFLMSDDTFLRNNSYISNKRSHDSVALSGITLADTFTPKFLDKDPYPACCSTVPPPDTTSVISLSIYSQDSAPRERPQPHSLRTYLIAEVNNTECDLLLVMLTFLSGWMYVQFDPLSDAVFIPGRDAITLSSTFVW